MKTLIDVFCRLNIGQVLLVLFMLASVIGIGTVILGNMIHHSKYLISKFAKFRKARRAKRRKAKLTNQFLFEVKQENDLAEFRDGVQSIILFVSITIVVVVVGHYMS